MVMLTRPLLLGHRGARGQAGLEENTLQAFDFALAQGCDGFEFDVRLSEDGLAVICHDAESRGQEIARCASGVLGLPLLGEVLARYRDAAFLDIELKVAGLERAVVDLLHDSLPARGCVVSSFLPEVLRTLHAAKTSIPLGLICETRAELSRWSELPVEFVIPHRALLQPSVIDEIKGKGKKVLVWTVNDPTEMVGLVKWGVDGIISDNPLLLAQTLGAGK